MAKSKKRKPSFDAPEIEGEPKGAAWVYRSDAPATPSASGRVAPSKMPRRTVAPPVSPAAVAPATPAAITPPPALAAITDTEKDARMLVDRYTRYAVAVGLVPLPVIDMVAISCLHVAMLGALCAVYGVPFSKERGRVLVAALLGGVMPTLAGHQILTTIAKRVTMIGTLFGMVSVSGFAVAATFAVGRVFVAHFESGGTLLDVDLAAAKERVAAHLKTSPRPAAG